MLGDTPPPPPPPPRRPNAKTGVRCPGFVFLCALDHTHIYVFSLFIISIVLIPRVLIPWVWSSGCTFGPHKIIFRERYGLD